MNRLAIIHIAKKQLGLDDEAYRAVLYGAGVTSSKDIRTEAQFNTVMSAFQKLGFKSTWIGRRINTSSVNTVSGAPGMISRRQEYYIKGLWILASRFKDEKSLRRIVKRIGKVDDISFLPKRSASAVILALRDICWKAGFNPDGNLRPSNLLFEGSAVVPDTKEGTNVYKCESGGGNSSDGDSTGVLSLVDGRDRGSQVRPALAACAGSGG